MKKISVISPYRISFSGGGTDVSPFPEMYGGCVINTTIDKGIRLNYVDDGQPLEISSRDLLKSWSFSKRVHNSFLEGIATLFREKGIEKGRLSISGDVPPGTGLGTSSALVLGLLQITKILNEERVTKADLAKETYDVERDFFGVTLGKQDPYAISFGGMKYVEFSGDNYRMEQFDYDSPFVKQLERSTLMVYTGSSHNSSDEMQEEISKMKEGSEELIGRLLEIKKNTEEARKSIKENDFERFVELVDGGWGLKKGLGKNITNNRVDDLIKSAKQNGAGAAKLMGGGSAGFILIISDQKNLWALQKKMMEFSEFVTRVSFDPVGARSVTF
jgi:D-glycero-alpha-D-manno-heptose-7-phosphate kinase